MLFRSWSSFVGFILKDRKQLLVKVFGFRFCSCGEVVGTFSFTCHLARVLTLRGSYVSFRATFSICDPSEVRHLIHSSNMLRSEAKALLSSWWSSLATFSSWLYHVYQQTRMTASVRYTFRCRKSRISWSPSTNSMAAIFVCCGRLFVSFGILAFVCVCS